MSAFSLLGSQLIEHGSFEEEVDFDKGKVGIGKWSDFEEKGFVLNFAKTAWAGGWLININTKPAQFSFTDEAGCSGKRALRVVAKEGVHVYTEKTYPANLNYAFSFSAKGLTAFSKAPAIRVLAYHYNHQKTVTAVVITKFNLSDTWAKYNGVIPKANGEIDELRLAFSFEGQCDLDGVNMEESL